IYRSFSRVYPPACFFRILPNSEGERSRSSLRREDTTDFRRWPLRAEVSSGTAEEVGLGSRFGEVTLSSPGGQILNSANQCDRSWQVHHCARTGMPPTPRTGGAQGPFVAAVRHHLCADLDLASRRGNVLGNVEHRVDCRCPVPRTRQPDQRTSLARSNRIVPVDQTIHDPIRGTGARIRARELALAFS